MGSHAESSWETLVCLLLQKAHCRVFPSCLHIASGDLVCATKHESHRFSKVPGRSLVIIIPNKPHFLVFRFSNMERKKSSQMKGLCFALAAPGHGAGGPPHTATSLSLKQQLLPWGVCLHFSLLWGRAGGVGLVVEFLKISKQ